MARTLLIGLDGATFTVLDALMDDGTMPFLREFVERGTRAVLRSTPNPLTPPAWTSIATGRGPGAHGIFDFIRAEERGGEMYFTLNNFRDIRCETIWAIASRQGRTVTALNFPIMAPPPAVAGHVVPGLTSWRHLRRSVHPPGLHQRLLAIPDLDFKKMAWDFELEKKAARVVPPEEYETWIRFHIERERHWAAVARHLLATEPSDLTAVIFDGADKLQHICWRFLDPALASTLASPWEQRIASLCREYFRALDGHLRELVTLAGPDADVMMASDHGFGPTREVFRVNVWLHQQGYLVWRDTSGLDDAGRASLERRINADFALLDWQKTTAYARTASSNGIYIRIAANGGGGVAADDYPHFREQLARRLLDVRSPATGERIVERVMTREAAFPGPWSSLAPDLTLTLKDSGFVSIANREPAVETRPEVAGTHRPEGILIAGGSRFRRGEVLGPIEMVDVAPTLLYCLGLPVPEDFEGRVVTEGLEASRLAADPPRRGAPTLSPEVSGSSRAPAVDADEAKVMNRLRALGYVE